MQFEARFKEAICAGDVSLTFRYWRSPRVRVGAVYRVKANVGVRVLSIASSSRISASDAHRCGFESPAELRSYLTRYQRGGGRTLYRIEFERVLADPDPRVQLAQQRVTGASLIELKSKLASMDRRGPTVPWTMRVLEMIAASPGRRAGDLAAEIGWETAPLKARIRRLKSLGLTESLEVGYRLSPRGQSLLSNS